jgi:NTE family protein
MEGENTEAKRSHWWEDRGKVKRTISGVFEGGGAKGVLYAGALRAVLKKQCWFEAVAGASAGAITATLIAAGLSVDQIEAEMDHALEALHKPTLLNGVLRVREGSSFLHQEKLLEWLKGLLERQMMNLCGKQASGHVSFEQLYEATGIELYVAAVDLKRERLIVFNHSLTPDCQVANAAVASAAIPVAFEWMPLEVPNKQFGVVVDGGVAANFPMFVFMDKSFRKWATLGEHHSTVVGFLLDEGEDQKPDEYREAAFTEPVSQIRSSLGFGPPEFKPRRERGSIGRVLWAALLPLRLLLWPFVQLFFRFWPYLLEKNSSIARFETWKGIPNKQVRQAIQWFDRILAGIHPWGFFVLGFVVVTFALGYSLITVFLGYSAGSLGEEIGLIGLGRAILAGEVHSPVTVILVVIYLLFLLTSIAALLYAWAVLIVVFGGASILHQSVRVTGYGLIRTFLKGPGAPPWAGTADEVIRLTVPDGITTLGVDAKVNLAEAIEKARAEAERQLNF